MKFNFLSKYFPPEKFLNPPHIGISFSDSNIKAILFDKTSSNPSLKSIVVPVEKGSIVAGKIINTNDVTEKLSIVKNFFDSPFVFFTIPDELTYIFSTSAPVNAKLDATESVAFTIEENVPLSLADTVFDFIPTKIVKLEPEYKASFVVAVCAKNEIEKFIKIIQDSGLEPIGCIHESQAIANALTSKNFKEKLCIVHARENRIGIYLIKEGIAHFSTLRSVLGDNYEQQFLDEYENFLEYCSKYNTEQNEPIEFVFVCGEFGCAKKVTEVLSNKGNPAQKVKLSNVWVNVLKIEKETPNVSYEDSLNLAGPIGAVLSDII